MNRPASRELRAENLELGEKSEKTTNCDSQRGEPTYACRMHWRIQSTFNAWMWRGLEILLISPKKPSGFPAE
jgi:hypothetical protein